MPRTSVCAVVENPRGEDGEGKGGRGKRFKKELKQRTKQKGKKTKVILPRKTDTVSPVGLEESAQTPRIQREKKETALKRSPAYLRHTHL